MTEVTVTAVGNGHTHTTNAPKGAMLFDALFPGWADDMDPTSFNIRSHVNCAVAQVAGQGWYLDGMRELFPAVRNDDAALHELARAYGFHIDVSHDAPIDAASLASYTPMWDALQADWERLIDERRTA
jgi:hypothetical protein